MLYMRLPKHLIVRRLKRLEAARVKSGDSYFATCERDDEGHCKPSGQGGAEAGEKPGPKNPNVTVDDAVKKIIDGDQNTARRMVGAPQGAEVRVKTEGGRLVLNITHPKVDMWVRYIGTDEAGDKYIENDSFFLDPEYQNSGFGSDVFANQVESASEMGFGYIKCAAVGGEGFNGYYTWPRFGYDQSLDDLEKQVAGGGKDVAGAARKAFPGAKSVLDIMETQEGRDWWKANGTTLMDARFDLTVGSRSQRVLAAYRKAKGKQ